MKNINAEQPPQNHRKTTAIQPVMLEIVNTNLPVIIKEEEVEIIPIEVKEPIVSREKVLIVLHKAEVISVKTLEGLLIGLEWTIRIGTPAGACIAVGYGLYLGGLWVVEMSTVFFAAAVAASKTIAIGFLSIFGVVVLLVSVISFIINGHKNQIPFEGTTPRHGHKDSRGQINIFNSVEGSEGSDINITNIIKR